MHPRYRFYWGTPPAWFTALSPIAQLGALVLFITLLPGAIYLSATVLMWLLANVFLTPQFFVGCIAFGLWALFCN